MGAVLLPLGLCGIDAVKKETLARQCPTLGVREGDEPRGT